ncbi:GNAT family N-acetyltransferase [Sutcliffiella horikoshii]|uniref:GNAT family N-acetyltransferase n=1 Tax=Sutcliffiella horikoshii TaxID=79883 RepID=UPI00204258CE|nr:GNAT family N-acetyltransferase [Sutcliffiella horikoshii]MCM3618323.1 GNAT family N-acetyltransferase [Sutcliffiella horikoshii]
MSEIFKSMEFEIVTKRLYLRMWEESDVSWYRELVGERGGDKPTLEAARDKIILFRERAIESGISLLPICRRDEGDVIGYCGLIIGRSTLEEPEIAYELFKRVHGQGYATEAASAVMEAAVATGRRRIWSTVRAWNHPSFRVLEKIGFKRHHSDWDEKGEIVWNVRDLN